jgi:hypothetical protein
MSRPIPNAPLTDTVIDPNMARDWLHRLREAAECSAWSWREPHVSTGVDGEALLEWWRQDRKLSLYLNDGVAAPEYIKVRGAHIDDDMESGELQSAGAFRALWTWLHTGD